MIKDCPSNLNALHRLLEDEGIKHEFKEHPVALHENVKPLIGYNPTGDHQIIVKGVSIIRGVVSFGYYEIMNTDGNTLRFETEDEVLAWLLGRFHNEKN